MRRAVIMAHYDQDGLIDPYLEHLLTALREVAEVIYLVSTAELNTDAQARAAGLVDRLILRENVGYDFYSLKIGREALRGDFPDLPFDEIIFCNDSLYGPLVPLPEILRRSEQLSAPVWGLTLGREPSAKTQFLQSYWFALRAELFDHPAIERFWQDLEILPRKREVIYKHEIGFSELLQREKIAYQALFDLRQFSTARIYRYLLSQIPWSRPWPIWLRYAMHCRLPRFLIPTHHLAAFLLDRGYPFVKIGLLRDNALQLNLEDVSERLDQRPDLAALIDGHMQRLSLDQACDALRQYLNERDDAPIIVYGAGEFFDSLLPKLDKRQIEITTVLDQRAADRPFHANGYPVHDPESVDIPAGAIITIASMSFQGEILRSLESKANAQNTEFTVITLRPYRVHNLSG